MSDEEIKHQEKSTIKIAINALLTAVVAVAFLLMQLFVIDDLTGSVKTGASWWLFKAISGIATFTLMISTANITEEARHKKDIDFNKRLNALDEHYQIVNKNYETEKLETYLENINKANKYSVYTQKYKKKLLKCNDEAKRALYEKKLLKSIDEVWDGAEKVRYHKLTYDLLVSGLLDVNENESDADIKVHKGRYGAQKLLWKALAIIAFGAFATDIIWSMAEFTKDDILPLIFKIGTVLISIYSGVCFGYFLIDREKTVAKKKLKIFSQFRHRIDTGDTQFLVAPHKDTVIEKIKDKHRTSLNAVNQTESEKQGIDLTNNVNTHTGAHTHAQDEVCETETLTKTQNPLKRTYEETFGQGVPVRLNQFGTMLLKNALQAEAEQSIIATKENPL